MSGMSSEGLVEFFVTDRESATSLSLTHDVVVDMLEDSIRLTWSLEAS